MRTVYQNNYDSAKIVDCDKQEISANTGLLQFNLVKKGTGFQSIVDGHLGRPGSGAGYRKSELFDLLTNLVYLGSDHVSDMRNVGKDPLVNRGGVMPVEQTFHNFLECLGQGGTSVEDMMEDLVVSCLRVVPKRRRGLIVDADEMAVAADKKESEWTYRGFKGMMSTMLFESSLGLVLAGDMEGGSSRPGAGKSGFLSDARRRLRAAGHKMSLFRGDAAYDNHEIKNWCFAHGVDFLLKARRTTKIRQMVFEAAASDWSEIKMVDGRHVSILELRYRSHECDKPYRLVVVRHLRDKYGTGQMEWDSNQDQVYATTLTKPSAVRIVWLYNQRGEHCENRIKELRSDFAVGTLPSSSLEGNRGWMMINMHAYNMFKVEKHIVCPNEPIRLKAFRARFCNVACRIVRSGRSFLIKVHGKYLDDILNNERLIREKLAV